MDDHLAECVAFGRICCGCCPVNSRNTLTATLLQSSRTLHCKHTTTSKSYGLELLGQLTALACKCAALPVSGCHCCTACENCVFTYPPPQSFSTPADTEPTPRKAPRSSRRDLPVLASPTGPNRTGHCREGESHEAPPTPRSEIFTIYRRDQRCVLVVLCYSGPAHGPMQSTAGRRGREWHQRPGEHGGSLAHYLPHHDICGHNGQSGRQHARKREEARHLGSCPSRSF